MSANRESLPFSQVDWPSLSRTRRNLALKFARSFDYSFVKSVCYAIREQRRQPGLEAVGEGAHFLTYRLVSGKDVDLAIGLAKSSFFKSLQVSKRNWVALMDQLSRLQHPLIPPFAIIQNDDGCLAFIRPFCRQEESELDSAVQSNLPQLKSTLLEELHRHQLDLDDYLQIRGIDGHPLVIDWSDLQMLPKLGSREKVV